jgi:hypothetical protein
LVDRVLRAAQVLGVLWLVTQWRRPLWFILQVVMRYRWGATAGGAVLLLMSVLLRRFRT